MNKERLRSGWVNALAAGAVLLIALSIAFFPLFDGKVIFEDDVTNYYLPAFHYYANAIASGDSIAITSGVFSGFPLALSQIGGFLDPINVLLFKLFPSLTTYHIRILLNYFLAGFLTYCFARSLRLSPLASVVAMFAYVTAQYLIPGANVLRSNSFHLMPALFLAIHGLYLTTNGRQWNRAVAYVGLGVVALAVSFLGGYTQLNLYSVVAAGAFALYLVYQRFSVPFLLWVAAMCVVGFALLAPYILAVLDLIPMSARSGGLSWAAASAGVALSQFVSYLTVNLFIPPWGESTLQSLYIGSLSVFFFLASWFAIKRKSLALFFWGLLGFSLLSAMPYPLFYLMHLLPVFDFFRFPLHWLFVGSFSMSMLAAIGFEYLQTSDRFPTVRNMLSHAGSFGVVVLLVMNFVLAMWLTIGRFTIPATALTDKPWVVAAIQEQEDNSTPFRTFQWYPGKLINSVNNFRGPLNRLQKQSLNSQYVQTHLTPLMWGVDSVRGFDNLVPRRYARVLAYLDDPTNVFGSASTADKLLVPPTMLATLGMMNVKYFWTPIPLPKGNKVVTLIDTKTFTYNGYVDIFLYKNNLFLPRVYVPSSVEVLPEQEDNFSSIIERSGDYAASSFIECSECEAGVMAQNETIAIDDLSIQNSAISFTSSSATAHWVVISNSSVPGWHAAVDDVKVPIHYANYIYQGILVPAGSHKVSVTYKGPYAGLFSI